MNQFSNIKSVTASNVINRRYLNRLREVGTADLIEANAQTRLDRFNIKTSVLEFAEMTANYTDMLRKHFRGYRELISFSNENFYKGGLQAIKIRGKDIGETLIFSILDPEETLVPPHRNTSEIEADFIFEQLDELLEQAEPPTVGVITPFTNQQKYLMGRVRMSEHERDYLDRLKLKVMTFDTCQGEERQLVFYSMVATDQVDRTNYVFPRDLSQAEEIEEVLRLQRLNVGFSRCQETMHFVVSKPIDAFRGGLGTALRHYQRELEQGDQVPDATVTGSPMEAKVLEWVKSSAFWARYRDTLSLRAQFPMGDYLRQLDPLYSHPNYRIDFLIQGQVVPEASRDANGDPLPGAAAEAVSIVIEYDGFREHFRNRSEVDEHNWEHYLSEDDIEREKVIESYGFKMLRVNRFTLGDDPVVTLSNRLMRLVNPRDHRVGVTQEVVAEIDAVVSGSKKECPKCGELKTVECFEDPTLKSGMGRTCLECKKSSTQTRRRKPSVRPTRIGPETCPQCDSPMVLRKARRGRRRGTSFYGCSRYPKCTGTRPYVSLASDTPNLNYS